jgi:hypothetical protein
MQCILAANFDRDLKLHIFICIGDIILACKEKCTRFIPNFTSLFDFSFAACVKLLQSPNEADRDYAEQL